MGFATLSPSYKGPVLFRGGGLRLRPGVGERLHRVLVPGAGEAAAADLVAARADALAKGPLAGLGDPATTARVLQEAATALDNLALVAKREAELRAELRKAAARFPETAHLGPDCHLFTARIVLADAIVAHGSHYYADSASHWHGDLDTGGKTVTTTAEAVAAIARTQWSPLTQSSSEPSGNSH